MNNLFLYSLEKEKIKKEFIKKEEELKLKYKNLIEKEKNISNLRIQKAKQYKDSQLSKIKEETRWQVDINTRSIKGLNNIQKKGNEIVEIGKQKENKIIRECEEVIRREKLRLEKELFLIDLKFKKEENEIKKEEKDRFSKRRILSTNF